MSTFENTFGVRLKSGGVYINESVNLDNNREDLGTFFRKKIYELDHMRGDILSIQFWSMVCIIFKS